MPYGQLSVFFPQRRRKDVRWLILFVFYVEREYFNNTTLYFVYCMTDRVLLKYLCSKVAEFSPRLRLFWRNRLGMINNFRLCKYSRNRNANSKLPELEMLDIIPTYRKSCSFTQKFEKHKLRRFSRKSASVRIFA